MHAPLKELEGKRGLISKLNINIYYYKLSLITLTEFYAFRKYKLWILPVTVRVHYRISSGVISLSDQGHVF